ncbi:MAG: tRNA lysidine(34) synthetase TilS [Desulfomonilaceae bacterium]
MTLTHGEDPFLQKVRSTIWAHRMIPQDTGVIVAVSGGPDSVAMLHALAHLSRDMGFRIVAAHFDHALRPESLHEAEFVARLADELGLEFRTERQNVLAYARSQKISVEEAGRLLRYDFLERVRQELGVPVIAVGHHIDDEVETFFLRLLKGASLEGLCGIAPVRGNIVRPLIRVTRSEIIAFLQRRELSFVVDSSNLEDATERNYVRNVVFPIVQKRFPAFQGAVHRAIAVLQDENQILDELAQKLYQSAVRIQDDGIYIDRLKLVNAAPGVSRRALLKAIYAVAGQRSRFARPHVHLVEGLLARDKPSGCVHLPHGIRVRRMYDLIHVGLHQSACQRPPYELKVESSGVVEIPEIRTRLRFETSAIQDHSLDFANPSVAYFDAELVPFPLLVRGPRPGDRMRPWGFPGSRKIKKILIESKVPQHVRHLIPLVVKDDEIMWIPSIRRSSTAPVSRKTRTILKVSLIGEAAGIFVQSMEKASPEDSERPSG